MSYDDAFVRGLEWMWGEGFLSPGGADEVAAIIGDAALAGRRVLDIGCGIGGIDALLAGRYGAVVTGIDVEPGLTRRARDLVRRHALDDRVAIALVAPGPLPFGDACFDVVFTKDSLIHVEDKPAMLAEIFRVLKTGGRLLASDWLGNGRPPSAAMTEWLEVVGLHFTLASAAQVEDMLRAAGFSAIRIRDRNDWYRRIVSEEVESVAGDNQRKLAALIGAEGARQRLRSSTAKRRVVDSGELRPTHFSAAKPAS